MLPAGLGWEEGGSLLCWDIGTLGVVSLIGSVCRVYGCQPCCCLPHWLVLSDLAWPGLACSGVGSAVQNKPGSFSSVVRVMQTSHTDHLAMSQLLCPLHSRQICPASQDVWRLNCQQPTRLILLYLAGGFAKLHGGGWLDARLQRLCWGHMLTGVWLCACRQLMPAAQASCMYHSCTVLFCMCGCSVVTCLRAHTSTACSFKLCVDQ